MSIEAIVGIIGVLVSIVGIYYGARATRVVVVHEHKKNAAQRVARSKPRGMARLLIALGMLLSFGGMGVFLLVVVNGITSASSQFGRPGSFQPPSLELIGPAVALIFAGMAFNALGRFLSRED